MEYPWWQGATVYQIYPRSFFDSNGDGIGDLPGLLQKLDYVASLGVDAIWISPFFKSPMKDFGYDVEDYRTVDPIFGSNDDFDSVLVRAHELGLKVIIDMVLNHSSDQHQWFQDSRNRMNGREDWYVWVDGEQGRPPNNWLSAFGGSAWSWDSQRKQYYYHHFLKEQPDFNFHNPDVRKALLEECKYWFEKGVDGFRLDVCNLFFHDKDLRNNPPKEELSGRVQHSENPYNGQHHVYDRSRPETLEFLAELRKLSDQYPDRFLMAEIFSDQSLKRMAEYVGGPGPLHSAYSFELLTNDLQKGQFEKVTSSFEAHAGKGWPAWSIGNHDIQRVASRWGEESDSMKRSFALMTLFFGLKGTLCLYQGDELGMSEAEVPFEKLQDPFGIKFYPEYKGRDGCRTPMPWSSAENAGFTEGKPWLPIADQHLDCNVEASLSNPLSLLHFVKSLVSLRRKHKSLVCGDIQFLQTDGRATAFVRRYESENILFAVNLEKKPERISLQGVGEELGEIYMSAEPREIILKDLNRIELEPNSYLVASLKGYR